MSAHVGLGPSSLADSFLLPGRFPRLLRAATSTRSHQRGFRLLYLTGHFEPRSVEQLRHGQAQHARPRSSLLLLHSGRLAVSSPLRGEPASSVTAHCRGATTTAVFATGYTPRSVGPARHLALLPASSVTAHCRGATTTAVLLPAIRRAQWAMQATSTRSSLRPHAIVHPYYATLGCRETRAVLVTGPSSGRGGG